MIMNDVNPRPWHITLYQLYDKNGNIVDLETIDNDDENKNLKHIVKCVNEHEDLIAMVKELNQSLTEAIDIIQDNIQDNKKLQNISIAELESIEKEHDEYIAKIEYLQKQNETLQKEIYELRTALKSILLHKTNSTP